MGTENSKLLFILFYEMLYWFFHFIMYKKACKFQILPFSAEALRETTEVKRRQKNHIWKILVSTIVEIKVRWNLHYF